jgi:hypothetical protein
MHNTPKKYQQNNVSNSLPKLEGRSNNAAHHYNSSNSLLI